MKNGRTISMVLVSGGIDSTACIHYYLDQDFDVRGVFIDYAQAASDKELCSAKNIASYYKIKLNHIIIKTPQIFSEGEIIGRNAFLVIATLLSLPKFRGIIALGIHSGVPYYDCSELFVRDINRIYDGYTDGQVILDAPFLKWNKKMIYEYCKDNNVPIHLTYSCELGGDKPCGKCRSCLDRSALNVS
jgi:7-cyano-7-deazaguanine synthase